MENIPYNAREQDEWQQDEEDENVIGILNNDSFESEHALNTKTKVQEPEAIRKQIKSTTMHTHEVVDDTIDRKPYTMQQQKLTNAHTSADHGNGFEYWKTSSNAEFELQQLAKQLESALTAVDRLKRENSQLRYRLNANDFGEKLTEQTNKVVELGLKYKEVVRENTTLKKELKQLGKEFADVSNAQTEMPQIVAKLVNEIQSLKQHMREIETKNHERERSERQRQQYLVSLELKNRKLQEQVLQLESKASKTSKKSKAREERTSEHLGIFAFDSSSRNYSTNGVGDCSLQNSTLTLKNTRGYTFNTPTLNSRLPTVTKRKSNAGSLLPALSTPNLHSHSPFPDKIDALNQTRDTSWDDIDVRMRTQQSTLSV